MPIRFDQRKGLFLLQVILLVMALAVLAATAFRIAARPFHIESIDAEVHQGHATDRWGEQADPDDSPDAATVWRNQQIAAYDRLTWILGIVAVPATIVIAGTATRVRANRTARSPPPPTADR